MLGGAVGLAGASNGIGGEGARGGARALCGGERDCVWMRECVAAVGQVVVVCGGGMRVAAAFRVALCRASVRLSCSRMLTCRVVDYGTLARWVSALVALPCALRCLCPCVALV